jgi:hypothetical protein
VIGREVPADAGLLRTPEAIRARCGNVLARGLAGDLRHFAVDQDRIAAVADRVARVTRERFPDLRIPLHSRWRHFGVGGRDRVAELSRALTRRPREARVRAKLDLVVTSVLLDAGAGDAWRYGERETGLCLSRSEGLAVATFRMFEAGLFSARPGDPWRADAEALEAVSDEALGSALQVSPANPLAGLEGRAALLRRLGAALRQAPPLFGPEAPRVGNVLEAVRARARQGEVEASAVLDLVLSGLATVWPRSLGDTWPHPAAGGEGATAGLVPLHKLSQWLTYSLVEPLEDAGLAVSGIDRLTALAEYRNGGLLVDLGVLVPKHTGVMGMAHPAGSEVVVEWRALTVALLDRVAPLVAGRLGLDPRALPMARLLEGGTWAAGRQLAEERRGGAPPIHVLGDGTIF